MNKSQARPPVGVVVAAHNAATTVGSALQSLQAQTYENWEAIVVDDGSTDDTSSVVSEYTSDSRIKLVRWKTNRGSGAARNFAISQLSVDLIAVLDADDICLPSRLDAQVAFLESEPDLAVVGAQVAEFGAWGGPDVSRTWPVADTEIRARLRRAMSVAHCVAMFRRRDFVDVGGYDERLPRAQDLALMLRLLYAGRRFGALPTVELFYRTQRPLPLQYALRSARGGYMARWWVSGATGVPPSWRIWLVNARSVATWGRRNLRELGSSVSKSVLQRTRLLRRRRGVDQR